MILCILLNNLLKNYLGTSETLVECKIICSIDHKDYYLYYVLKRHPGRTIVFCNSIGCVKRFGLYFYNLFSLYLIIYFLLYFRLAQLFGILNCKPLPIHASMQQRQRLKNLDRLVIILIKFRFTINNALNDFRFRDDPEGVLIATDVAARGLDIPNVDHVIHYQVPRTAEVFLKNYMNYYFEYYINFHLL